MRAAGASFATASRAALLTAVVLGAAPILAQGPEPGPAPLPPDAAAAALARLEPEPGSAPAPGPGLDAMDEETQALVVERFRRYQRHQIEALEHRERLFRWQLRANQTSFVVVLLLVLAGIAFSGIQFAHSLRTARDGDAASVHELAIGAQGITVKSSVIGLIVLALSLGFFYLYLVHVFPLEELEPSGEAPAAESRTGGE